MAVELVKLTAPDIWVGRFGERFRSSATRDPYDGVVVVQGWRGDHCEIGPMLARFGSPFTLATRNDLLKDCAELGFLAAHTERVHEGHSGLWVYDLTTQKFTRSKA